MSVEQGRPVVDISDLRFAWPRGPRVLSLSAFRVEAGEKLFLKGPSGSGKSTLLGLVCGVREPQAGSLRVLGKDLTAMSAARRDAFRAAHLGVIFQMFNLLPYLPVIENAALPASFSKARAARAAARSGSPGAEARRLLARLGIGENLHERSASLLSVGQQQRVAVARALLGAPDLIVADEPTSALDGETRDGFITLLIEECARSGASLLFVSHDAALAEHFDREVDLRAVNEVSTAEPRSGPQSGEAA